jgi:hypothetical protein
MPPEQNGPVAGDAAIRAGYQVAERRFDTADHAPAQPVELLLGIRLQGFRPLLKRAPIGFADIELPGGLLVHDCLVLRAKDGGAWAALPANPVVDRTGKQKADVNGERQFVPMLEWRSRELGSRFSAAGIAPIEQACHGALGGSAP